MNPPGFVALDRIEPSAEQNLVPRLFFHFSHCFLDPSSRKKNQKILDPTILPHYRDRLYQAWHSSTQAFRSFDNPKRAWTSFFPSKKSLSTRCQLTALRMELQNLL